MNALEKGGEAGSGAQVVEGRFVGEFGQEDGAFFIGLFERVESLFLLSQLGENDGAAERRGIAFRLTSFSRGEFQHFEPIPARSVGEIGAVQFFGIGDGGLRILAGE